MSLPIYTLETAAEQRDAYLLHCLVALLDAVFGGGGIYDIGALRTNGVTEVLEPVASLWNLPTSNSALIISLFNNVLFEALRKDLSGVYQLSSRDFEEFMAQVMQPSWI
jgi:hypothetical protein